MADPKPLADDASGVHDFLVPDLGEGLVDATVVEWLVAPGDRVSLNQPLCAVETAKAAVEVPSPWAGSVVALGGTVGETLAVGALLVRIALTAPTPGPAVPERQPTLVGYGPDSSTGRRRPKRAPATAEPPLVGTPATKPLAAPPVRKLARDLGVDLAALAPGSGPGGTVTRADVRSGASAGTAPAQASVVVDQPPGSPGDTISVIGVRAR